MVKVNTARTLRNMITYAKNGVKKSRNLSLTDYDNDCKEKYNEDYGK